MVELSEKETRVESEGWATKTVVARKQDRRVSMEKVACESWQGARSEREVAACNLEQGYLMFMFQEAKEWDLIMGGPWMVAGKALAVKPKQP